MEMRSLWLVPLVTAACVPFRGSPRHPPPPPPVVSLDSLKQLGFSAHATNGGLQSTPNPIAVQVTVTVVNTAGRDTTVRLLEGDCEVLLRFYRKPDRSGPTALDTSGPGVECFIVGHRHKLAAGDSIRFTSPRDGPSSQLPAGRYWITALLTWITPDGSGRTEIPAGEIRVPQS
jgi:hypothetical protein